MLEDTNRIVARAEREAEAGHIDDVLSILRELCLMDFGVLLLEMPHPDYPNLSRRLPRMAAEQVQRDWTGAAGMHLLHGTVDFVRMVQLNFEKLALRKLHDARILDYGCGYGRIARLMYWFTNPADLTGVDPWDRSIEICQQDGLLGQFVQSDYLPDTLPLGNAKFDLIFSFSVFTHLSLLSAHKALRVLRRHIRDNGVLLITLRPIDFWHVVQRITPEQQQHMIQLHRRVGFAYAPNPYPPVGEEALFGDTTIDPRWLAQEFPEWRLAGYDRGIDSWQTIICLTPR